MRRGPRSDERDYENFDVAAFLWASVERWALLTLRDVHQLALAYGWGEGDVLALSPLRRQLYLEMAYG